MLNRKPLVWFLVLAFAISWVFFLIPLALTNLDSSTRQYATLGLWTLGM